MNIKTVIEQPDGTYTFTGVLNQEQHAFLIEYAIRDLVAKGLLPAAIQRPADSAETVLSVPTFDATTPVQ